MADRYANFAELAAAETEGVDYRIVAENRASRVVVFAPHGGRIEPGTSEIVTSIAQDELSLYLFEGLRSRPHGDLHITSTRFDEPTALALIGSAETAIGVHGRADGEDAQTVWLGGLDEGLRDAIRSSLEGAGFVAVPAQHGLAGREPLNICNRTSSGVGAQLELPRRLRRLLEDDDAMLQSFGSAVRDAIDMNSCNRRIELSR